MKERPIIFNDPMARAVFEDRKTMTRRPVKHLSALGDPADWCWRINDPEFNRIVGDYLRFSPYGVPGDRLWVRETFCDDWRESQGVVYRADGGLDSDMFDAGCRWRPSIHMPRWAARSVREIVSVRVERVQDISEADAIAEGCECDVWDQCQVTRDYSGENQWFQMWTDNQPGYCPADRLFRESFRTLWDSIYGTTEYAWGNNPPVWVYEFRRVEA